MSEIRGGHEGATARVASLTEGQRECLRLVGRLMTSKEIGLELKVSRHAVDDRIRRALQTLDVTSRAHAANLLAAYETDTPQRLMPQPSRVATAFDTGDYTLSPGGIAPFGEEVRNELAEGQAAYFAPSLQADPRERWSFREVFLVEHNLPITSRIAVILGVALAGVVLAAMLVNLAEGLSRLA